VWVVRYCLDYRTFSYILDEQKDFADHRYLIHGYCIKGLAGLVWKLSLFKLGACWGRFSSLIEVFEERCSKCQGIGESLVQTGICKVSTRDHRYVIVQYLLKIRLPGLPPRSLCSKRLSLMLINLMHLESFPKLSVLVHRCFQSRTRALLLCDLVLASPHILYLWSHNQ